MRNQPKSVSIRPREPEWRSVQARCTWVLSAPRGACIKAHASGEAAASGVAASKAKKRRYHKLGQATRARAEEREERRATTTTAQAATAGRATASDESDDARQRPWTEALNLPTRELIGTATVDTARRTASSEASGMATPEDGKGKRAHAR